MSEEDAAARQALESKTTRSGGHRTAELTALKNPGPAEPGRAGAAENFGRVEAAEPRSGLDPANPTAPLVRGEAGRQDASASRARGPEQAGQSVEAGQSLRAAERIVDRALLEKTLDSHRLNLVLSDQRLGRVSLRLVERAGLVQAILRTDNVQGARMISESLPGLLESLYERGIQASAAGSGSSQGQAHYDDDPGRGRRQGRHPDRPERRGGARARAVFRLALDG